VRHHESVGGHVASFARARPEDTAGAILARMAADKPASVELVLMVDAEGRLSGVVPIARLFSMQPGQRLGEAADREFPALPLTTTRNAPRRLPCITASMPCRW
jgi:Mg/Co/Ni transporter MgtE